MTRIRFLHTSDLQLGMKRHFLDPDAHARFDAARLAALARIGEVAVQEKCDFIVMAGDIFEYNSVSPRTLGRALEIFQKFSIPTYLLPGNHDPLVADSILRRVVAAANNENLYLIENNQPIFINDAETVQIIGAPLLARHVNRDLVAEAVADLAPDPTIRVVVGHGQPYGYGGEELDLIDIKALEPMLKAGTIDYVALGDTHSETKLSETGAIWFSGAPEVTDFRGPDGGMEHKSGFALLVDIEKTAPQQAQVEVTSQPIGQWRFQALEADINSSAEVADFLSVLQNLPHKERTVIKYALRGSLDLAAMQQLEGGISQLRPVFAALYPRERLMDLHLNPDATELSDLQLTGFPAAALNELAAAEETAAISLFFRLLAPLQPQHTPPAWEALAAKDQK
ncbi:metallophosphoesterase family protein [Corynebacterium caspium]|uniref:metallophosphoesterase family protein n=1 Tax=Corynebacterium caspium TaxID=234828 RepID=UPI00039CB254|nr:DNA repair exonuclease [Corynebacterium caspium]WKD59483.1 putative metallophosphoesterase YhaO [Corynebacterium caspium DSM 44850]